MKTVEEVKKMLVGNAEDNSVYLRWNVETYAHGEMWQERFIAVLDSIKRDVRDGKTSPEAYETIRSEIMKYL